MTQHVNLKMFFFFPCSFFEVDVTAATVGGIHNAEDNIFTTTVATSGSLPEHMLVNHHAAAAAAGSVQTVGLCVSEWEDDCPTQRRSWSPENYFHCGSR